MTNPVPDDKNEQPTQEQIVFTNECPEDTEWIAHIYLLNEQTEPDRYLRDIIQYARSGPHYPADMHVALIKQVEAKIAETEQRALMYGQMQVLEMLYMTNTINKELFDFYSNPLMLAKNHRHKSKKWPFANDVPAKFAQLTDKNVGNPTNSEDK